MTESERIHTISWWVSTIMLMSGITVMVYMGDIGAAMWAFFTLLWYWEYMDKDKELDRLRERARRLEEQCRKLRNESFKGEEI